MIQEYEPPRPSTRISESGDALPSLSTVRKSEPAKLSKLLRGDLDWIVMKALEKDRTRRFETANEFALDIERYLNDEMVLARPPSASYRVRKFVRRNQGWLAAAGIVLLALIAATVVSSWQAVRATKAERLASNRLIDSEAQRDRAQVAERDANEQRLRAERALAAEEQARAAAETAQATAEQERRQAVEVSDLLVEMFGSPDPERQGWRITVAEALDLWAAPIALGFSGDPEVKSKLLHVVGKTFRASGDPKRAVELLEQAKSLRDHTLGPRHPDTLETAVELATVYRTTGAVDQSEKLYLDTIEAMESEIGETDLRTLTARRDLADGHLAEGNAARAIAIYLDVLKKMEATLPVSHLEVLTTKSNLAYAQMVDGQLEEAVSLQKTALDAFRETLGPQHPRTLGAMSLLADLYLRSRDAEKGVALFEETHRLRNEILGPNHVLVFAAAANLARAYRQSGRVEEAISLYERTLPEMEKRLGDRHRRTLVLKNSIAVAHASRGNLAKARTELETLIEAMDDVMGKGAPETLNARANLVGILFALDEFAEAVAQQHIVVGQFEEKYGRTDTRTQQALKMLDVLKQAQKKKIDADE